MKDRTAQDLLAERHDNVQERRRERDPMARAMLQLHIDTIDVELKRRRNGERQTLRAVNGQNIPY